jgi:hypothetical protein
MCKPNKLVQRKCVLKLRETKLILQKTEEASRVVSQETKKTDQVSKQFLGCFLVDRVCTPSRRPTKAILCFISVPS